MRPAGTVLWQIYRIDVQALHDAQGGIGMKIMNNKIHEILREFRKKTYFRQVLLSYIIVSCFTFLIFSILLLSKIQQENEKTILNFGWRNIEQAVSFNNSSLSDIVVYGYQVLDEADTYHLLYGDTYDFREKISSREIYDRLQSVNSMIVSLDFINFSTGTVLTKTQRMSLENYYDKDLIDYIRSLTPSRSPVFYQPRESYTIGNHRQKQQVLSLIFYTNSRGALVINLDYATYASQINLSDESGNMDLLILNQNKYVMAATDESCFMQDFSDDPIYMEIQRQPSYKGSFIYHSKNGLQTVLYQRDDRMGMTYISVISHYRTYSRSYLFALTFRYSIIYILVTSMLSLLASMILYRPIKHLNRTIRSRKSLFDEYDDRDSNDFELFESAFQNIAEKYTVLKRQTQTFESQQEQKLLHLLLEQTAAIGFPMSEELAALDSTFEFENYMVFVVHADIPSDRALGFDASLVKFLIENVTVELMNGIAAVRSVETVSLRALFIANFAGPDEDRKKRFREASQKLQHFFNQHGQFRISVGFGCVSDALDSLSVSYETARTALNRGMLHNRSCIVFYEDIDILPLHEQKYPFTAESEIMTAIRGTDATALEAGLDRFFDALKDYDYDQVHRHIAHFEDALWQFEYTSDLNYTLTDHDLMDSPQLLSEYREQLGLRCQSDIQALTEIKLHSHSRDSLIAQIQDFVTDNLYNSNLSVVMIAEKVGLSVNYLRNIYKENTGESLSSYITNRKLEIIYELLSKTDISIQEISDRLGFATKNYFFTFFKKHTGMTPSQYRNLNQP